MKRLFISQPMRDKTAEEIKAVRERATVTARKALGEEVEVIDSVIPQNVFMPGNRQLWCLGEALKLMATADVVYFADNWKEYRGCLIEYRCAKDYGLEVIGDLL